MFRFYDLSCQATHARLTCRKYNRLNSRPLQKKVQYQFPRKKRENEKRICLHDLFARVCNCTSTCTSANPCSKWPPTFAPALIISLRSSDSALSLAWIGSLYPFIACPYAFQPSGILARLPKPFLPPVSPVSYIIHWNSCAEVSLRRRKRRKGRGALFANRHTRACAN